MTQVIQVSPENQVRTVSILVPLVLVIIIEFASVARDVTPERIKESWVNRLTFVHGISWFLLAFAFDITVVWGEFATEILGTVVVVVWVAFPLVEVGFYDRIFGAKDGFQIVNSSLTINAVTVFVMLGYIRFIHSIGLPPVEPLYIRLAELLFRFGLEIASVYTFIWYLRRDVSYTEKAEIE